VTNWDGTPIGGYVAEFGNKPVGGDFIGKSTSFTSMRVSAPAPVKVAPNFFQKAGKFLSSLVKANPKPKNPALPATFTTKLKVQVNIAGTYFIYMKRPDGRGVPFPYEAKSWSQVGKQKKQTLTKQAFGMTVKTTKDNEIITINGIVRTDSMAKPGGIKLYFSLVAPREEPANRQCLTNWCQLQNLLAPKK